MNLRWVKMALMCGTAAVLIPGLSQPAGRGCAEPLSNSDRQALRGLGEQYVAEWLAGRPRGVMSVFEKDAVIMPHHGVTPKEGEQAIRGFWWPPDSPPFQLKELTMTPDEIGGAGSMAFVRGKSTLAYSYQNNGKWEEFSNRGTYLMVARKNDKGEWRIARFMWDDPVPQTR